MISQYSKAEDIDREFWKDYERALYWLRKKMDAKSQRMKLVDAGWDVYNFRQKYSMSEPVYYNSPQTGNRWLTWITMKRDGKGDMHFYMRAVLYLYTEAYMTMMLALKMAEEDDDGIIHKMTNTVNVYTAHMFQRMADKDRLGVDMSDRVSVMRNFTEFVAAGWSDTRPPRDGEKHTQILFRTPASWLRGHVVYVGDRCVNYYRTFWADKSMSYKQMNEVKKFKKFADMKMSEKQKKDGDGIAGQ